MKSRPRVKITANGESGAWVRAHLGSILVFGVLLPLMACLVLILPPIQLPARIASAGYTSINKAGASVTDPDGTELSIPEGAVTRGSSVKINSFPLESFATNPLSQDFPANLEVKSPLYTFSVEGERPKQSNLSLPIPLDAQPYETIDLYARANQQWFKIPFILNTDDERLESGLNFVPDAVVIVQTSPHAPIISADIVARGTLPDSANDVLVEANPVGLRLADGGSIAGDPVASPEVNPSSTFAVVPTVTNVDQNGARVDLTANMINDDKQRAAHINALVDLAVQRVYRGYNISYEGVGVGDGPLFTQFIKELAHALHAQQKILSVTLPAPKPISEVEWDTAGYDWALIGRYADEVKIPILPGAKAFEGDPALQEQYLRWAVSQVDRSKIQLSYSALGRDESKDQFAPVGFNNALTLLGPIGAPQSIQPGQEVTLDMPGLSNAGGIQIHEPSGMFYFNYVDPKTEPHTVWLANADSLSKQIGLMLKFNIGGIALQDLDTKAGLDDRVWTVLQNYKALKSTVLADELAIIWIVDGKSIGKSTVRDPKITWTAPEDSGTHNIEVALSVDGGTTVGPSYGTLAVNLTKVTPTPVPTEVPPTEEAKPAATPKPKTNSNPPPAAKPTAAPAAAAGGGKFNGRNMFGYGIQIDWTNKDRATEMGQVNNMGFNWVKIQVRWCDMEGSKGSVDYGATDDLVNQANAHGIKVLFSVVCAPPWSRADGGAGGSGPPDNMQDAADFMGGLAGHFCGRGLGAIEVWNEENLITEWHGHQLSAQAYIDMISKAYPAIHAACNDIVVVSGAPTPTGFNDGITAFDDGTFLEQMYQAGLKNYSDAIGAHPSGYNVPALCNDLDPACNRPEASFQAPFQNRHHSWGFLATMTTYRNIMVKYGDAGKQVWPTEFGWPVGNGGTACGGPCHPAGVDNTADQAAGWYRDAYQWSKQAGWVGVMTAWQLDFDRGELDAFRILGRPAYDALAAMPK